MLNITRKHPYGSETEFTSSIKLENGQYEIGVEQEYLFKQYFLNTYYIFFQKLFLLVSTRTAT